MSPEEIEIFFDRLRNVADDLSSARKQVADMRVKHYKKGYSLQHIGVQKRHLEESLAYIEASLLKALEPLDILE